MPGKTLRYRIHGIPELTQNVRALRARAIPAGKAALMEEAEIVMGLSKLEVPVREGVLRASGHVVPPVIRAGTIFVQAAYGGPAAPYALRQHEELDYHHTVGKAHYLSDPFHAREAGLAGRIAARLGAEVLRGLR